MPQVPPEDDQFIRKISFFEATTESIAQFTLGDIIIRTYGVSDDLTTRFFQLFSLASSMLSLVVSFISVSTVTSYTHWFQISITFYHSRYKSI